MELQAPHRVCIEVRKEDLLQLETENRREKSKETMRMEGCEGNRGGCQS